MWFTRDEGGVVVVINSAANGVDARDVGGVVVVINSAANGVDAAAKQPYIPLASRSVQAMARFFDAVTPGNECSGLSLCNVDIISIMNLTMRVYDWCRHALCTRTHVDAKQNPTTCVQKVAACVAQKGHTMSL